MSPAKILIAGLDVFAVRKSDEDHVQSTNLNVSC